MSDHQRTVTIDAQTEREARRLAEATNQTLEQVIADAIAARGAGLGILSPVAPRRPSPDEIKRATDELVAALQALPVLDPRTPDELISYDEHGLPA